MDLARSWDTGGQADSIERVDVCGEPALSVGTYAYDELLGTRSGCLSLYRIGDLQAGRCAPFASTEPGPGVLDVSWRGGTAALALSDGTVGFVRLSDTALHVSHTVAVDTRSVAMAVAWSSSEGVYACTTDGDVHHVDGNASCSERIGRHACEVWTVSSDPHAPHIAHAGDDSGLWMQWDDRVDACGLSPAAKVKHHTAGVCTIAPHPTDPHAIATGSYDRSVCIWDRRQATRPLIVADALATSGVWRLRWRFGALAASAPENYDLLAACMYDGVRILRCDLSSSQILERSHAIPEATAHGVSLAYGAAWVDSGRVATSTFYTREAQLWSVPDS